jgi:hypothetical protein
LDVDGELQHEGTTVLVFHKDGFFRVLPNVRSTSGKNQLILKKSSYRLRVTDWSSSKDCPSPIPCPNGPI